MPRDAMTDRDLVEVTAADGGELLEAARSGWSRPVPHCPAWDAARLVGHTGSVLAWMTRIVTTGGPVARRDRERPPDRPDDLPAWYTDRLERAVDVLTTTAAATPVWTFSSRDERGIGWWRRRLAVELAIHRRDAQHAAGGHDAARPLDADVAAVGIEEFLAEFLPGLLAAPGIDGLTGTLRLHATDEGSEWWFDLDARAVAVPRQAEAEIDVRGTRSDVLLWLTNHGPTAAVEVLGRRDVAARWGHLRR